MKEKALELAAKSLDTANGLLARIFGPAADGLGVNIAQGVKLRTVENQIRGLRKLQDICDREKFPMKQVNLKALFPYLEGIALEEEPLLEDMWANLMANYLDSSTHLMSDVYPHILKQMSTFEAELLLNRVQTNSRLIVTGKQATKWYDGNKNQPIVEISQIANLHRLGLVENYLRAEKSSPNAEDSDVVVYPSSNFMITDFAVQFVKACTRELRNKNNETKKA